ncbi:carbohydrate ABC transporter permease [Leifsonia poae]|uniref:carbohydrate ABC transporter permease n=1 Tax=Leifsonia poae TaxID=110933 RepID=UPI003D67F4FE
MALPTAVGGALKAPRPAGRRRNSLSRRRGVLGVIYVAPAAVLLGLFFIWPLIRTVYISFFDYPLLGPSSFVGVQNYIDAFSDSEFGQAVVFTLFYTVITTPVLLAVGFGLAALVRRRTRAARIFQTVYFVPVVIGLASASYLWVFIWQPDIGPLTDLLARLGIGDASTNLFANPGTAFLIVLGMVVWKTAGLQMLLLLSGIQSIPEEVVEASRMDGAGRWQTFRLITLPLLRPTLALVLVFSVAGSLLAFDQFYIMTSGGPDNSTITAVFQIYRTGFVQFHLGYASALSILLMLVLGAVSVVQMLLLRNADD